MKFNEETINEETINEETINKIEEAIGYSFKKKGLLQQAFTRESYAKERRALGETKYGNEQLEFFGDSVLNYILILNAQKTFSTLINDALVPYESEGKLTSFISHLSEKTMLASCIDKLAFAEHLVLSQGDKAVGVEKSISVKEDLFEAIVGAMWIDSDNNILEIESAVMQMLGQEFFSMQDYSSPINKLKKWSDKNKTDVVYTSNFKEGKYEVTCRVLYQENNIDGISINEKLKTAEKEAAQSVLLQLEKIGVYNTPIIKEGDFIEDTAINKLQEISQQGKVGLINYESKYDYSNSTWNSFCTISNYENIFCGTDKLKTNAKKKAAFEALNYLVNAADPKVFNPFKKEVMYMVYEWPKEEFNFRIGIIDSKTNTYNKCKAYPDNYEISIGKGSLNKDTVFVSVYNAAAFYFACKYDCFFEEWYDAESFMQYFRWKEINANKEFTDLEQLDFMKNLIDNFDWKENEKFDPDEVEIWW